MNNINPIQILREATKNVPAVRYALGITGIAAAATIIKALGINWAVAFFVIVVMIILMIVLLIFAKLTKLSANKHHVPALVLMWSALIITILIVALIFTSLFFDYPLKLKDVIPSVLTHSNNPLISNQVLISGEITDGDGVALIDAWVYVVFGKYKTRKFVTGYDGRFIFKLDSVADLEGAIVYYGKDSVSDHKILYSAEYLKLKLMIPAKKEISSTKSFVITNDFIEVKAKRKIANLLGAIYTTESLTKICFKYDETKLERLDDGDYRYNMRGTIMVYVNGSVCNVIDEFKIEPSGKLGAPLKEIERAIYNQFNLFVNNNFALVAKKIKSCLN